jgi:hypothetical protein
MDYYNYGVGGMNPVYGGQYPQYTNPYFQPQQLQNNCQCENRFMWIQGKEAAKSYPMAPDKTIFFLDDKESYAYLKKTDRDGKTVEFKTFQLVEEQEPEPIQQNVSGDVVTKEEFTRFASDINASLQNLMKSMVDIQTNMNKPYNNKRQVNNNGQSANGAAR